MSNGIRFVTTLLLSVLPLLASSAPESAEKISIKPWSKQQLAPAERSALEAFYGPDLRSKNGPMHKVGHELTRLFYVEPSLGLLSTDKLKANQLATLPLKQTADNRHFVLVEATANGDANALRSRLEQLGAKNLSVYPPMVSGWVPVDALDQVAAIDALRFMRPSRAATQTGSVISQGDFAIRGPSVRPPTNPIGPTGAGVNVGVISNSYNCLGGAAADIVNGEFPTGVTVIRETPVCTPSDDDEGRAMLQIVADVAPNASLLFASGNGGIAAFANAVTALANNGAKVIVDDQFYFASPWFQDGIINASINDVVLNKGIAYFSAANNYSSHSYESPFRPSTITGNDGGVLHDFDPAAGTQDVLSLVFIPTGATATILMQWDEPFASACGGCPGSQSDMDIYFVSAADGSTIGSPGGDFNIGNDPFEVASFTNLGPSDFFIFVIENFAGPAPGLIKLIYTNDQLTYENDSQASTAVGPGHAANAVAVGAAEFYQTPACDISPPQLATFSSRGGAKILFSASGARLATPEVRQKPEIVAPQGGNTTFFGPDISDPGTSTRGECQDFELLPNFIGTSAAAPHAAGVAALLLDAIPSLTPQQLYAGMKSSAIDMLSPGFDFDSGFGLLQADAAFARLADTTPDPFSFSSINAADPNVQPVSDTIVIAGTNTAAPVSVTAGQYSIGCNGTFTTVPGSIQPSQSICLRHTTSSSFSTSTTTTLTVDGISGTFTSTTRAPDTTPDPFTFVDQNGVAPSSLVTSNVVTITGIEVPVRISVTQGQHSIGCGATFTPDTVTISNGQTVCVRHTAPSTFNTTSEPTILQVGGLSGPFPVSATFTSTTRAAPPSNGGGGGGGGACGTALILSLLLGLSRRCAAHRNVRGH